MQFAALQYDMVWENKSANHAIVEHMLVEASLDAGTFVVLPELGDTGFSFNLPAIVDDLTLEWGCALASRMGLWLQVGHARLDDQGKGLNCATIITPQGEIAGTYHKIHPFSYGREAEHYEGGRDLLICDCNGLKVCPLICYDLRFPELWRLAALSGAEVFTIGASWPEARQDHWRTLLSARAIENQAYVIAANRVGADPNLGYAGGSMMISPRGERIAEAGGEPDLIQGAIDADLVRVWREEFPALRDVQRELLGTIRVI